MKKTIGFIGCGNMGSSILRGLLACKLTQGNRVFVYDTDLKKVKSLQKSLGVKRARSCEELIKKSEVVVLAVKPQRLAEVAAACKSILGRQQIVISILAGVSLKALRKALGDKAAYVRVMPNLGATIQEGLSALCAADKRALKIAVSVFSACGKTLILKEHLMNLVTALSGSGPAYFFLLMELLEREAIRGGIPEKLARLLIVQTAVGALLLARNSEHSPSQLRALVTSKGGTTEAALKIFERSGLGSMVAKAVGAARRRAKELEK